MKGQTHNSKKKLASIGSPKPVVKNYTVKPYDDDLCISFASFILKSKRR